jgi:4-hydroxyacetophenone monooxygenase
VRGDAPRPDPIRREAGTFVTKAITASDDELRRVLDDAVLPPLLVALAHLTGDLSLLRDELRIDPASIAEPQGGFTEEQQATARQMAFDVLRRYRDAGSPPPAAVSEHDLVAMMRFATGTEVMREYVALLEEELAVGGEDRRAPGWVKRDVSPDVAYRVAIIGAGMSGLVAAYRLQQAGVPFIVVEKDTDVGGTWWENTYPGCRVDNPNHNYSYSFAQRHDWPMHYSTQDVLARYFRNFADQHGLVEHIRFATEVESATWSDGDHRWTLRTRAADGTVDELVVDAVISATGQLNRPHVPDIPGRDTFGGTVFHSARWPAGLDLSAKRVAVIGTGASAAQFIPIVAEQAQLTVFQRTPAWFAPTADYHEPVQDGLRWLYEHVPMYSEWNRFWIFWTMGDGQLGFVTADPDWVPKDTAVSAMNDDMRQLLASYLEEQFAGRPDLLAKVTPSYPPGSKRMLRDNGVWAGALTRDNVELVTTGISEINAGGVAGADGRQHDVDVIIYGTGFLASKFLTPMTVSGRDGVDLHQRWGDEARAYLGITIPHFPNLYLLYGPNTNLVINGSIIYFSECAVRYILGCIRLALEHGGHAVEVRQDVHDAYNQRRRTQRADGVGHLDRQRLVQERRRPHHPELAVHPPRILGTHPSTRPRRLPVHRRPDPARATPHRPRHPLHHLTTSATNPP